MQTPLRGITGFAQVVRRKHADALSDEGHEYLDRIVNAAKRMQTLINDLLAYSRVQSQGKALTALKLETVVGDVVELLTTHLSETKTELAIGSLPTILGDEVQLRQLFQNLIENAIKYRSEEVAKISIAARRDEEVWLISVQDNGIGIDAKHHERIFEVFRRLHGSDDYPGTGIGLALCRRIVTRHGGRIWAEAAPDQGTTFHFTLQASPKS